MIVSETLLSSRFQQYLFFIHGAQPDVSIFCWSSLFLMIIMSSDYWSCFHSWYVSMIPTRSTQQSSPASPCCCNSRPDGDNQFPEAQKTTRLPGRTSITSRESSKATSVPQQESTNPARPQVSPISAQTSPKTRGQRCRAQPENPARSLQAGGQKFI